VQRVVGVLIGVAVALGVAQFIPLDGWAVAAVVFVGLLIGRVLRLGPSGMVQVPVSALLVLFVGSVSSGYPGRRIIDTVIGAAIGVAVVLVSPTAPRAEAIVSSATEPLRGAAGLLTAMGSGIAQPWTKHQAEGWHGQAVALVASIADARGSLESAKLAARWNARARSLPPQLERADDALSAGRRVCIHLRSMTLALTAVPEGEPPKPVLGEVTVLLAQVVLAYGEWMTHDEDEASRRRFESATWACEQRLGAFVELAEERWQSDAQRWLTLGVVLAGIQRILAVVTEPIDA